MKKFADCFLNSVLAGIMISIGGVAFLKSENRYIGALLFTVGLISVLYYQMNLYTGKVGYMFQNNVSYAVSLLYIILGNAVGCLIIAMCFAPIGNVADICSAKIDKGALRVIIDSAMCGLLVFISVDSYKVKNTVVGVLVCIPAFIICGFEHSVADMFYLFNARIFTAESFVFLAEVIIGNALGCLLLPVSGIALKALRKDGCKTS